jgi:hypothetical protein
MSASGTFVPPLTVFPRKKIWKRSLWMEHRRAQFRLAIQVVGLRRIYLLNDSIILFTSKAFGRWKLLADGWWLFFTHQKFICDG